MTGKRKSHRLVDLTGKIFGELTVLQRYDDPSTTSAAWLCRCSCGVEKAIAGYALLRGHYNSCGCKRDEKRDVGVKKHIEKDRVAGTRKTALQAKLHINNKSGVKGVIWLESRRKWKAYIGFKGKNISLGYYVNKEDAISARKVAEERYHKPIFDDSKD